MGKDKLDLLIKGRSVLEHSLRKIISIPQCEEIVIVTRPEKIAPIQKLIPSLAFAGTVQVIAGGRERQHSVANGLAKVSADADLVLIHDAARPFTTPETFRLTIDAALRHGASVCGSPVTDTIKRVATDGRILETPPREELRAVQTPQVFSTALIRDAYTKLSTTDLVMTDDTAVAAWAGYEVYVVTCPDPNPKITYPGDCELYAHLLPG